MEDEVALAIKARERVLDIVVLLESVCCGASENLLHSDEGSSIGPFLWLWTRTIRSTAAMKTAFFTIFCPLVEKLREVAIRFAMTYANEVSSARGNEQATMVS